MPKDVLKNIYSNMYGEGKTFQNNNPSDTMTGLINKKEKNKVSPPPAYDMNIKPPSFTMWGIVVFSITLVLLSLLYYFKDIILSYYHTWTNEIKKVTPIQTVEKTLSEPDPAPAPAPTPTIQVSTIQSEEKEKIEKKEKQENGAIRQLKNKMDTSLFRKDQLVKKDGFCYIGYEKGHRVCTDVFQGDVCMSGEIFPTMDVCLVPTLRP